MRYINLRLTYLLTSSLQLCSHGIAMQANAVRRCVEQSTAKSVVFLFMWRHDLQTESTVVHAVELSSVELSCVAINTPLAFHCTDSIG